MKNLILSYINRLNSVCAPERFKALQEKCLGIKCFITVFFILSLGCMTEILVAQETNFKFSYLTVENGLSNNIIWNILQDSHGFMWFTTSDGLNRYDGYNFRVFKKEAGNPNSLRNNNIEGIFEDRNGHIWLGGQNKGSLSKYDPRSELFFHYFTESDSSKNLPGNGIIAFHEDASGFLWLAVVKDENQNKMDRLIKFNPATGVFQRIHIEPDEPDILDYKKFYADKSGCLWIITNSDGLICYNPHTGSSVRYRHDPGNRNSLSDNSVGPFFEDQEGILWIATAQGVLNKFDRKNNRFTHYSYARKNANPEQILYLDILPSIIDDHQGNLWIATDGDGLVIFNRERKTFSFCRHDPDKSQGLNIDRLSSIYQDRSGAIWIGTIGRGLNIFNPMQQRFIHYKHDPDNPNSLNDNNVWAIYEDRGKNIWLGHNHGLDLFEPSPQRFTHFQPVTGDPTSISTGKNISTIFEDSRGILWIGSWSGGLNRFDRKTRRFRHYTHNPNDKFSICSDIISAIYEDIYGNLWIGAHSGLSIFNIKKEQFLSPDDFYQQNLDHIGSFAIRTFYQDPGMNGKVLWIGSWYNGLIRFNLENGEFRQYQYLPDDPNSLSDNNIKIIHQDKQGFLWIGTTMGLNKFDKTGETFIHYTTQNGLPGDAIYGILEDEKRNLWISTNNGLSRFDTQTETFKNYNLSDGLQGVEFKECSYFRDANGNMYFGGNNGFNVFHPDSIRDNPYIPLVYITDFKLFNRSVPIGGDSPLQKPIWDTDQITLNHKQNIFSLEFAALNYVSSAKNQYKYKLEGLETDWNLVDSKQRFTTYTSLPAGNYIFRVQGSNNDAVWNESGASLKIIILPPWWETIWFRAFAVLVALSLFSAGFWLRINSLKQRSRKLENQVAARTKELNIAKEKAETANEAKSKFLTNMSHELRTPLNAIIGYAQILKNWRIDPPVVDRLNIIHQSGEHLLMLINDILDLSKIEAGKMELYPAQLHLLSFLETISSIIRQRAEIKDINFSFETTNSLPIGVHADATRLRQVLLNLLGNAVKFTDSGKVTLRVKRVDPQDPTGARLIESHAILRFEVEDTGIGIPHDQLENIFVPFEQVKDEKHNSKGTGLGLPISRRLVRLMGSDLFVKSAPGQGSLFWFELTLPVTIAVAKAPVLLEKIVSGYTCREPDHLKSMDLAQNVPGRKTGRTSSTRLKILVADDISINRAIINGFLSPLGFDVLEAADGKQAIDLARDTHPDLIIIDQRMPKMSGFETFEKLRQIPELQDIPAINMSASVTPEDQELSRKAGFADFLPKPVNWTDLMMLLEKYLDLEWKYQEKITTRFTEEPGEIITPPKEQIKELYHMAIKGDIWGISEHIEHLDKQYTLFAQKMKKLADNFESRSILNFIKYYMDKN